MEGLELKMINTMMEFFLDDTLSLVEKAVNEPDGEEETSAITAQKRLLLFLELSKIISSKFNISDVDELIFHSGYDLEFLKEFKRKMLKEEESYHGEKQWNWIK
ncbi:MAG: hypothetical protein PHY44_02650 [Lachnospiraceae bacterium]|nr:hypothetical protein [Lachnospiraceae bacterium]